MGKEKGIKVLQEYEKTLILSLSLREYKSKRNMYDFISKQLNRSLTCIRDFFRKLKKG